MATITCRVDTDENVGNGMNEINTKLSITYPSGELEYTIELGETAIHFIDTIPIRVSVMMSK